MADIVDVEIALANLVGGIVYPNGTGQPSIINADVKIRRGWPIAAQLDLDMQGLALQAGVQINRAGGTLTNISIFSPPGTERNTTRYPQEPQASANNKTLTATVSGNQVVIGGTVSTPQNVMVLCGSKQAFPYQVQAGDTLDSIATNLAALIAASFPGTGASGAAITIDGAPGVVTARVGGQFTIWTEEKRQERAIQITCWCPTPAIRDALGPPLDAALGKMNFFATSDNSAVRFRYARTIISDAGEKVQIFRRDLFYTVDYPTTEITTAPETVAIGAAAALDGAQQSLTQYI